MVRTAVGKSIRHSENPRADVPLEHVRHRLKVGRRSFLQSSSRRHQILVDSVLRPYRRPVALSSDGSGTGRGKGRRSEERMGIRMRWGRGSW